MKNKWSPKKVKRLQLWLAERWPQLFAERPDQLPLSLSIRKEILQYRSENPELSGRLLNEALKRHVTGYGYLYGMQKHSHRYDLLGNQVDTVSKLHRAWARNTLRVKQKQAQKICKEKIASLRAAKKSGLARKIDCENRVAAKTTGPVIKYKPSRKKRLTHEADLAS